MRKLSIPRLPFVDAPGGAAEHSFSKSFLHPAMPEARGRLGGDRFTESGTVRLRGCAGSFGGGCAGLVGFAGGCDGGLGIFRNFFFVAVNMTLGDLDREEVLKMVGIGVISPA